MDFNELINVAVDVGYYILENGAEIYRVEESVQRIIHAYGVQEAEVFAIPSCIIVTLSTDDGKSFTKTKRIHSRWTNLDRVEQLNSLCRKICDEKPDFRIIRQELRDINNRHIYSLMVQIIATAFIAFFFTLFFGGAFRDALCSFAIGIFLRVITHTMDSFKTNVFFTNIIASGFTAILAVFMVNLNIGIDVNKIIIGTLMNLVPGVAITNSIRDIIAGDLIAGLTKLTEAILTATAMAVGAGLALSASRIF